MPAHKLCAAVAFDAALEERPVRRLIVETLTAKIADRKVVRVRHEMLYSTLRHLVVLQAIHQQRTVAFHLKINSCCCWAEVASGSFQKKWKNRLKRGK